MKEFSINHSSLSSAFQHVKENHGCAGVDGVTIERFEKNLDLNLARLQDELERQIYFSLPLMKILVEKKNGEPRVLCIPAVRDRVVETAVLQMIGPVLEKEFEDCSFAYRKGRSVKQVVYKIKDYYDKGYRWVVDADIDAFFDSVDHKLLLAKLRRYIHDPNIQRLFELLNTQSDIFCSRRCYLADEPSSSRKKGHLNAMLKKFMHSLCGELDISEDKNCVYLVALHIKKDFILLLHNKPVTGFAENGILFCQIKICHFSISAFFHHEAHENHEEIIKPFVHKLTQASLVLNADALLTRIQ